MKQSLELSYVAVMSCNIMYWWSRATQLLLNSRPTAVITDYHMVFT